MQLLYLFNEFIFWYFNDLHISSVAISVEVEMVTSQLAKDEQKQFIVVSFVSQVVSKRLQTKKGAHMDRIYGIVALLVHPSKGTHTNTLKYDVIVHNLIQLRCKKSVD